MLSCLNSVLLNWNESKCFSTTLLRKLIYCLLFKESGKLTFEMKSNVLIESEKNAFSDSIFSFGSNVKSSNSGEYFSNKKESNSANVLGMPNEKPSSRKLLSSSIKCGFCLNLWVFISELSSFSWEQEKRKSVKMTRAKNVFLNINSYCN